MQSGWFAEIAADYVQEHRGRARVELAYFRDLPTDEAAVSSAALCELPTGKRHPHQRRIERAALEEIRRRLLANLQVLRAAASFEELFLLVKKIIEPIPRIGPLAVYDTALRIGSRFALQPSRVYLHRGALAGARALGLDVTGHVIDMDSLPSELRVLSPREAEDALCIYQAELAQIVRGERPDVGSTVDCGSSGTRRSRGTVFAPTVSWAEGFLPSSSWMVGAGHPYS